MTRGGVFFGVESLLLKTLEKKGIASDAMMKQVYLLCHMCKTVTVVSSAMKVGIENTAQRRGFVSQGRERNTSQRTRLECR